MPDEDLDKRIDWCISRLCEMQKPFQAQAWYSLEGIKSTLCEARAQLWGQARKADPPSKPEPRYSMPIEEMDVCEVRALIWREFLFGMYLHVYDNECVAGVNQYVGNHYITRDRYPTVACQGVLRKIAEEHGQLTPDGRVLLKKPEVA